MRPPADSCCSVPCSLPWLWPWVWGGLGRKELPLPPSSRRHCPEPQTWGLLPFGHEGPGREGKVSAEMGRPQLWVPGSAPDPHTRVK